MKKFFLFLAILLLPYSLWATEDYYQFDNQVEQQRFQTLTSELRCLVCQNQNLADSNASLAVDLRNQVYKKIQEGQSNEEIIHYLVTRYGNFVLYKPPFNNMTLLLWLGPFLVLLSGLLYLFYYLKKR